MLQKRFLFAIIVSLCILINGCGETTLIESPGLETLSEFCVKLLLKYDAGNHSRLLDEENLLQALEEAKQTTNEIEVVDSKAYESDMPKFPDSVDLNVECISQLPELPCGCEATALAICLKFRGYEVDKCDIADNYLPKTSEWKDLNGGEEAFLGNPRSVENGWYCLAGCVCKTIDNYNLANECSISYKNLTGSKPETLYTEIAYGNPCIVWGTIGWEEPKLWDGKLDPSIEGYYYNLHCVVLSGYSAETVTIEDPLEGETIIDKETFEDIFEKMGSRAVVIY